MHLTKKILLDVGGVIIQSNRDLVFRRYQEELGVDNKKLKTILAEWNSLLYKNKANAAEKKLKALADESGISETIIKRLQSDLWASEFRNDALMSWIDENSKKYEFYLLTNNYKKLSKTLKKYKVPNIWQGVVNSADIGYVKPQPEFFIYALKVIKAVPEECIFIDDSRENVESAEKLGIPSIHFKGNENCFLEIQKRLR